MLKQKTRAAAIGRPS